MEKTVMTAREALTAIVEAGVSEDVTAWATKELGKLDSRNSAAREKRTAKYEAEAPMREAILEMLGIGEDAAIAGSLIAEAMEISGPKVTALMKVLEAEGKVGDTKVKSTAKSGGMVKGYFRIAE